MVKKKIFCTLVITTEKKFNIGMKPSDPGFYSPLEIKEEQNYESTSHFSDICGGVGYVLFFAYLKYLILKKHLSTSRFNIIQWK